MSDVNKDSVQEIAIREGLAEQKETLWSVYWRRFNKHTLGKIGGIILVVFYLTAIFAGFLSPFTMIWSDKTKSYHPPTQVNLSYHNAETGRNEFRPFVYEKRNINVALKKYGVVPEYTLRAISIEPIINKLELRKVVVEKDVATRHDEIVRAIAGHYSLPSNHEAIDRIRAELIKLENDPQTDVTYKVPVMTTNVNGKDTVLEVMLVKGNKNFVGLFNKGIKYKFLGLFPTTRHFFGSETGGYFPLGCDNVGREMLSRLFHGSRISLSVGLIGVAISFVIGMLFGGIAGYFGGIVDTIMMRFSEIIFAFPSIYLLFTLRAAFPPNMTSIQVYLLIIVILSMINWAGLARIVRGLVLSIKSEDYVMSARTMGLSNLKIITKHILPNTMSVIIIQATLSIPRYILGESALSLLGLGIAEPQSSWGLMLSAARNHRVVADFPWVLIPGAAIFLAIMAWNLFGDGVRDAVDPRSKH